MNTVPEPKFKSGDTAIFLGSTNSRYGHNRYADKYVGSLVTIKSRHPDVHPYAYRIEEFCRDYWFEERCFDMVAPELPDFVADMELDMLLL